MHDRRAAPWQHSCESTDCQSDTSAIVNPSKSRFIGRLSQFTIRGLLKPLPILRVPTGRASRLWEPRSHSGRLVRYSISPGQSFLTSSIAASVPRGQQPAWPVHLALVPDSPQGACVSTRRVAPRLIHRTAGQTMSTYQLEYAHSSRGKCAGGSRARVNRPIRHASGEAHH